VQEGTGSSHLRQPLLDPVWGIPQSLALCLRELRTHKSPICSILARFVSTILLALTLGCILSSVVRATSYYQYDNLGRVIRVTESDGSSSTYAYDASGNVTTISRTAGTSTLSIGSTSSGSGAVGSQVTITGTGFSSVATQDVVTFGGVAAQVAYASGNRLVVTVPAGATTGDIEITTPSGSVSTTTPFQIQPVAITGFSPTTTTIGSTITLTGSGFDATVANDQVAVNTTSATPTTASATQLQFAVPTGATSGHITVTTSHGVATSVGMLLIPAPGYVSSNIAAEAQLTAGGPGHVFTIDTANQVGVGLFDGTAGQLMSLVLTDVSMGGTYTVYKPDGSVLASGNVANNLVIDLPALPTSGTYSWYFVPGAAIGSATLTVQADATGAIQTNGTPVSLELAGGQNAIYTFAGVAGQSYSLELTPFSSVPAGGSIVASILKPDGTLLTGCGSYFSANTPTGNCDFSVTTSGTYSVTLVPAGLNTTSFGLVLNQDFSATLTAGSPGPTVDVNLAAIGQHGKLSFTATAGQTLALYIGSVSTTASNVVVNVYGVTGGLLTAANVNSTTTATFNLTNLAAGTYSVLITL
jgi:YD repeat-containing protein